MIIEAEGLIKEKYNDIQGSIELRLMIEKAKANPDYDLLRYSSIV
jgi:hypothetical protein